MTTEDAYKKAVELVVESLTNWHLPEFNPAPLIIAVMHALIADDVPPVGAPDVKSWAHGHGLPL